MMDWDWWENQVKMYENMFMEKNNMNNQNSMSEWFNRNIVEKVCSHSKHKHGEVVAEYTNGTPLVVYYALYRNIYYLYLLCCSYIHKKPLLHCSKFIGCVINPLICFLVWILFFCGWKLLLLFCENVKHHNWA